jgi:single-stranded DNA-binding protein
MSNQIRITGNVGQAPTSKKAGNAPLTEFTLFSDAYQYEAETKTYKELPGQWYTVLCWGEKLQKQVFELVQKGARLEVVGRLQMREYVSKESGKTVAVLDVHAEDILFKLSRIESVTLKPRTGKAVAAGSDTTVPGDDPFADTPAPLAA